MGLLPALAAACTAAAAKPHLLLLLADDYGWANVGFHAKDMHTPNIDKLATEEGFELSRLYAYRFCSPTRSALMSGRLPVHVNQHNSATWGWTAAPVDPAMKMLPEKLQEAGYYTVHSGKWHLGLSKQSFTPVGRGFNESLTMLMGSEDHFTQHNGGAGASHVDLWSSDRPAFGRNGTYSANLFGGYACDMLEQHAALRAGQPLFMYLAYTVTHSPVEAPDRFTSLYPASWVKGRRDYAGMASALDESVGNVTATLKRLGMWANTLLVFSSDNGGPSLVGGASYANNYPLRGSKGDDFEGGTRVLGCVSGGLVPPRQFGRLLPVRGHVHVADWYATFCGLAGHPDCSDAPPGKPATESHDMWDLISGQVDYSTRNESLLSYITSGGTQGDAALLQGDMKYIVGKQSGNGYWWGPAYPNSTKKLPMNAPGCPEGCLFNVTADPSEHNDLSAALPDLKAQMKARLEELGGTVYQSDADGTYDYDGAKAKAQAADWWMPWL